MELIGSLICVAGVIFGAVNFNVGRNVHIHFLGFDTEQMWWWRYALVAGSVGLILFIRHAAKHRGWRS